MLNILYGVSGEGSGHSSRAQVIASHLISEGHRVKIVTYDRAYSNLCDDFDVFEVEGLTIVSEDNRVSKRKTFASNLTKFPGGLRSLVRLRSLIRQFRPDCVICDFEPYTAHLASHYNLPLITLDNQHRLRYMELDYPAALKKDARLTEMVIRGIAPRPWVSLVTSFHFEEIKNERTFVFPPILRESIMGLTPSRGDHILIYVTSGFESLIEVLPQFETEKFIVYGYDKSETLGNTQFKPFSTSGFAADLASAKAVIATAGFTLMTESLYLGKPYLALPMQGQFEQQINAVMLERQGMGCCANTPDVTTIQTFLQTLPSYYERLEDFPRNGNTRITAMLDSLLKNDMNKLLNYRR